MAALLHGDFGTILESAGGGNGSVGTSTLAMSVSVVAGVGFEPAILRLRALWQFLGRNDRKEMTA